MLDFSSLLGGASDIHTFSTPLMLKIHFRLLNSNTDYESLNSLNHVTISTLDADMSLIFVDFSKENCLDHPPINYNGILIY